MLSLLLHALLTIQSLFPRIIKYLGRNNRLIYNNNGNDRGLFELQDYCQRNNDLMVKAQLKYSHNPCFIQTTC